MPNTFDSIVTKLCPTAFERDGLLALPSIEGVKCVGVDTIYITKMKAEQFRKNAKLPDYDRNFDQKHSDFLLEEMLARRFVPAQAILTIVQLDRVDYRLDLKHTLAAIERLESNYYLPIALALYEAADEQAMRRLYMSLDSNKPRTPDDKAYAALQADPAFADSTKQELIQLVRGFRFYYFNQRGGRLNIWEILTRMKSQQYLKLTQQVFELIHNASDSDAAGPLVRKAAVVGAMFQVIASNPKKGVTFWKQVLGTLDYRGTTSSPQVQLVAKLSGTKVSLGKSDRHLPFLLCLNAYGNFAGQRQGEITPTQAQIDAGRPPRTEPKFG